MNNRLLRKIKFIGKSDGTSMMPIIYPSDGIYIKPTLIGQLIVNDIITFQKKDKLISHRVIYKNDSFLITKGDNCPQSDGKIYSHQIIGKVTKVKRDGKEFDPNQAGYQRIAEDVFNYLTNNKLIPCY